MARDQLPGFKQNLEIGEMEEKDTKETQRGWQLDVFFEEKDKRTEDERSSGDSIHGGT